MISSTVGRATIHTAPGCTTISRKASCPAGSITRSSRTSMLPPLYARRELRIFPSPIGFLRFQYRPQRSDEFINLLFGNNERRQHSQHRFVCAIQDEALLQKLFYDFFSWNR